jgi:flagellar basal body-associated protein FliL
MEAVFIALMALVVLLTGWVSIIVLWRLFKDDNGNNARRAVERASRV